MLKILYLPVTFFVFLCVHVVQFELREVSSVFFRFKPFFPIQVLPSDEYEDRDLSIQDILLTEGRLKVTLIECTRYIFVHFCSFLTKEGSVSLVCSN